MDGHMHDMCKRDVSARVVGQGNVGRVEAEPFNHKPSENPCRSRQYNINHYSALS